MDYGTSGNDGKCDTVGYFRFGKSGSCTQCNDGVERIDQILSKIYAAVWGYDFNGLSGMFLNEFYISAIAFVEINFKKQK